MLPSFVEGAGVIADDGGVRLQRRSVLCYLAGSSGHGLQRNRALGPAVAVGGQLAVQGESHPGILGGKLHLSGPRHGGPELLADFCPASG